MYHDNATVNALMKRGYLYLEDHEWKNAKGYFDDALDVDPENSSAYVGMLLAELHIEKEEDIIKADASFVDNYYYQKALRFANGEYLKILQEYNLDNIYFRAAKRFANATSEQDYIDAGEIFLSIEDYRDAKTQIEKCKNAAEVARVETLYNSAKELMDSKTETDIQKAKQIFDSLEGYKDCEECSHKCDELFLKVTKQNAISRRKILLCISICVIAIVGVAVLWTGLKISANNKLSDEIYQNFLGKTFDGEMRDDDGYAYASNNNSINEHTVYWLTIEEKSLVFKDDGSVYYATVNDMTVIAYPSSISEPDGNHNEYGGTYSDFKIRVTFDGEIYLDLGTSSYEVVVDDNNVPIKILDYDGMTLK